MNHQNQLSVESQSDHFDHPRTSNGPTEAINGRLEHLRGSALGFRNLTNYIAYAEFRISGGMSTSGLC